MSTTTTTKQQQQNNGGEGKDVYMLLVRHGQSEYNSINKFCGWIDCDLTKQGEKEAETAGKTLQEVISNEGPVEAIFTSVLLRAIKTCDIIQKNCPPITSINPVRSWRLNERHYGDLQGKNKKEATVKYGIDQVQKWRRTFDEKIPLAQEGTANDPKTDPKYKDVKREDLPLSETLKTTIERVSPFYHDLIVPFLKNGKNVMVVAHGNTTRSLIKHISPITEEEIALMEIPTGIPLIMKYHIESDGLKFVEHRFLADPEVVKAAQQKVANQIFLDTK